MTTTVDGGGTLWLALALSYFLSCRASEVWAYADEKVDPEFCSTRNCHPFLLGDELLLLLLLLLL